MTQLGEYDAISDTLDGLYYEFSPHCIEEDHKDRNSPVLAQKMENLKAFMTEMIPLIQGLKGSLMEDKR